MVFQDSALCWHLDNFQVTSLTPLVFVTVIIVVIFVVIFVTRSKGSLMPVSARHNACICAAAGVLKIVALSDSLASRGMQSNAVRGRRVC